AARPHRRGERTKQLCSACPLVPPSIVFGSPRPELEVHRRTRRRARSGAPPAPIQSAKTSVTDYESAVVGRIGNPSYKGCQKREGPTQVPQRLPASANMLWNQTSSGARWTAAM